MSSQIAELQPENTRCIRVRVDIYDIEIRKEGGDDVDVAGARNSRSDSVDTLG